MLLPTPNEQERKKSLSTIKLFNTFHFAYFVIKPEFNDQFCAIADNDWWCLQRLSIIVIIVYRVILKQNSITILRSKNFGYSTNCFKIKKKKSNSNQNNCVVDSTRMQFTRIFANSRRNTAYSI